MRTRDLCVAAGIAITLGAGACTSRPFVLGSADGGGDAATNGAADDGAPAGNDGGIVLGGGSDGALDLGGTTPGTVDGGGAEVTCGASDVTASSIPVSILLVIDKSGSMSEPLGTGTRWSAMKTALATSLDKVKATMSFGLEFFPNAADPKQTCEVPAGEAAIVIPVGPGASTAPAIANAFEATQPAGGTPTAAALERAYDYFTKGAGKSLTGNRFVLLATDGGPNCNPSLSCTSATCTLNLDDPARKCGPPAMDGSPANCCDAKVPNGPSNCLDDGGTTAQIQKLAMVGVKTFVVGMAGTEAYAKSLDQFAVAGGEVNPGAPPSYFAVSESGGVAGLTSVFSAITSRLITTCRLQLQSNPPDTKKLNVSVDGSLVAPGPDGWQLDTSTAPPTIVLNGATCSKVQTSGASSVRIVYGCPTITID